MRLSTPFAFVLAALAAFAPAVRADWQPIAHVETAVGRLLPQPAPKLGEMAVAVDTFGSTTSQSVAASWSDGAMFAADKLGILDAYSASKTIQLSNGGNVELGAAWLGRFKIPAARLALGGQSDIGKRHRSEMGVFLGGLTPKIEGQCWSFFSV